MRIETLVNLPTNCVYALINTSGSRVYVNYSTDLLGSLSRVVRLIKDGEFGSKELTRDISSVELEILSETSDTETLKLHTLYWKEVYVARGFSFYKDQKVPLQYVCKVRLGEDMTPQVVLVNRRNDSKVVGVFETLGAAEEFRTACYNATVNPWCFPVYATNSLTREYIRSRYGRMNW